MANTARVGAALQRWRKARDLRQTEVATAVGVTQGAISSSESGSYSAGLLLKLLALYRPDAADLAEVLGAPDEPSPDSSARA